MSMKFSLPEVSTEGIVDVSALKEEIKILQGHIKVQDKMIRNLCDHMWKAAKMLHEIPDRDIKPKLNFKTIPVAVLKTLISKISRAVNVLDSAGSISYGARTANNEDEYYKRHR